ncbi:LuxR C-terminal-related transcriptional regulator [Amycolatopsis sp. NPDC059021]|uniref:helix-turn-helix transcriptional regulator n=1 Tax=Amycolatopsis sp. NPDC059021 TaxID=3346704 RepID=UPI003671C030
MANAGRESNSPRPVRGRAAQRAQITAALRAAAEDGRGRILLMDAPAGSGKTRLIREAVCLAESRGFSVVDRIAHEPPTDGARPETDETRTTAREIDRLARHTARLHRLVRDRLRQGPVVVAVDDLHELDALTLSALGSVTGGFAAAPVVWLLAARAGDGRSPHGLLLKALARAGHAEWIQPLDALPAAVVAEIAGDLLGARPDPDLVALSACLDGSPGAVVALFEGLRADRALEFDGGVARLAAGELTRPSSVADAGTRLPERFLALMRERFGRLSMASRQLLQVAAVLGRSFTARDLAEMLDESPAALLRPLWEAQAEGILAGRGAGFAFRADLLWRAALALVPAHLLALLHRQAATMHLARGGESADEAAAACHLVRCAEPGDTEAITTIAEAANRLLAAAPETAATLALRGMEIAERGAPEHFALATTAMTALMRSGSLDRAAEVADRVVGGVPAGVQEQSVRANLATIMVLRGETRKALSLAPEPRRAPDDERDCGTPCPDVVRLTALSFSDSPAAERTADGLLAEPGGPRCDDLVATALAVRATACWNAGRIGDAFRAMERSVERWRRLSGALTAYPLWQKAWMLVRAHQLDEAEAVIAEMNDVISAAGAKVVASVPLVLRGWVRLLRGDLDGAESAAAEAVAHFHETQMLLTLPTLHAVRVLVALRRGDVAVAGRRVRSLEESVPTDPDHPLWTLRCRVAAQVPAAGGDAAAALEILLRAGERRGLILADPAAAAWYVRTSLAAKRPDIGREFAEAAEAVSAANPGYPVFGVAASHARALLDRDAAAIAEVAGQYPDPWVRASAIEDAGVLRCGTDRPAGIAGLARAMDAYEAAGAAWDAARVRRRLRGLGVRRRHWNHAPRPETGWASLTDTEEKVARLVARGLTNRQVASELFVSPHTVGFHLRQIYRKLGIQSRVDLARIAPGR